MAAVVMTSGVARMRCTIAASCSVTVLPSKSTPLSDRVAALFPDLADVAVPATRSIRLAAGRDHGRPLRGQVDADMRSSSRERDERRRRGDSSRLRARTLARTTITLVFRRCRPGSDASCAASASAASLMLAAEWNSAACRSPSA